jgi:glutamate synthase (NADPH/NADH) small chain
MAATKMLKFTESAQAYPPKRVADERTHDFLEIARPYIIAKAEEQAARCSQCGVPFCQVHCPLHNNIPDWLKLTAEGRLEEAYELSAAGPLVRRQLRHRGGFRIGHHRRC